MLIAQCTEFMGPALGRVFAALGAAVVGDPRALGDDTGLADNSRWMEKIWAEPALRHGEARAARSVNAGSPG